MRQLQHFREIIEGCEGRACPGICLYSLGSQKPQHNMYEAKISETACGWFTNTQSCAHMWWLNLLFFSIKLSHTTDENLEIPKKTSN